MPSTPIGPVCEFLIPVRRDRRLSDGEPHATTTWSWFEGQLWERFGVVRRSAARELASWRDKSGERIRDSSVLYTIAVPDDKVDELRKLLMEACVRFYQECLYLAVEGRAELVSQ